MFHSQRVPQILNIKNVQHFTDLAKLPRKTTSQRLLRLRLQFRPQVVVAVAIQHYAAGHASASLTEAATWEMLVAIATMSIPIL